MGKIKCPACCGYATTSGHPNLLNHIKNTAKGELLRKHIGIETKLLHAEYLRGCIESAEKIVTKQKIILRMGNKIVTLKV